MNTAMARTPKPFLRWAGGKTRVINSLGNELWPEKFNRSTHTYFEPFLGGGAMFFNFLPESVVLSDLNSCLVNAYNQIKLNVESVIQLVKDHEKNMKLRDRKEYYYEVRARTSDLSEIEAASRFLFLNATCFNGIHRVNKKGQFNAPFGYTDQSGRKTLCNEINLKAVSEALQNVQIKNQDYKEAIKRAKEGDFIYLDPPYHPVSGSSFSYTSGGFTERDQIELRGHFIDLVNKGCFVELSNSDTPFTEELYSGIEGVNIRKISVGRYISGDTNKRGRVQELLISNF